jgi:hypothetical protein
VSTRHGSAVHNRIRRAMVYTALTRTDFRLGEAMVSHPRTRTVTLTREGRLSLGRPLKPRSNPAHPARDTCSGGTRARQGMACSSAWASCSTTWSCAGGAATCTPIGMPLLCQASGNEIAGVPIRL